MMSTQTTYTECKSSGESFFLKSCIVQRGLFCPLWRKKPLPAAMNVESDVSMRDWRYPHIFLFEMNHSRNSMQERRLDWGSKSPPPSGMDGPVSTISSTFLFLRVPKTFHQLGIEANTRRIVFFFNKEYILGSCPVSIPINFIHGCKKQSPI